MGMYKNGENVLRCNRYLGNRITEFVVWLWDMTDGDVSRIITNTGLKIGWIWYHLSRLGTQKEEKKGQFQNNNTVAIINTNDDA